MEINQVLFISSQNIKDGIRCDRHNCAVALAFKELFKNNISVRGNRIIIYDPMDSFNFTSVSLSKKVSNFIFSFDDTEEKEVQPTYLTIRMHREAVRLLVPKES